MCVHAIQCVNIDILYKQVAQQSAKSVTPPLKVTSKAEDTLYCSV